jgi:PLP dependent protein
MISSSLLLLARSSLSFLRSTPPPVVVAVSLWKERPVPIRAAAVRSMASESTPSSPESSTTDATILAEVAANYRSVYQSVQALNPQVRLVAVSKTKPVALLQAVYDAGCRHFGENYVQEMIEKVAALPKDVTWHFIGTLQSNKAKLLVSSIVCKSGNRNLTVETITSIKLADKLQQAAEEYLILPTIQPITVFVQINTSDEDSKNGVCTIEQATILCRHIMDNCNRLKLVGLMTIGAVNDPSCFETLGNYKHAIEESLNCPPLELSMGMSNDYAAAIQAGSTNVRVGSTIFGAREYNK